MRVEDSWEDYSIWYVEFQPIGKKVREKVGKFLAFESNYSEKDISEFVLSNFSNVECVDYIDLWMDHCMKPNQKSYDEFIEHQGVRSKF